MNVKDVTSFSEEYKGGKHKHIDLEFMLELKDGHDTAKIDNENEDISM